MLATIGKAPEERLNLEVVQKKENAEAVVQALDDLSQSSDEGEGNEMVALEIKNAIIDNEGRQSSWLDDMVAAVQSSLRGVPADARQWEHVKAAFRDGLIFAFTKNFSGGGDWGWVIVRTSMRSKLAIIHGNARCLEEIKSEGNPTVTTRAVISFVKPEPAWKAILREALQDDDGIRVLKAFLDANQLGMPLVLQPHFTSIILPLVWRDISDQARQKDWFTKLLNVLVVFRCCFCFRKRLPSCGYFLSVSRR